MARHTFDKLVERFAFAMEMLREGRKLKSEPRSETKSKQKRCVDRNLKIISGSKKAYVK